MFGGSSSTYPEERGNAAAQDEEVDLKDRLRAIFDNRTTVPVGCVHLVGVDELRERIGSKRWQAVGERVHQFVQKTLNQKLGARDAWFRHGEDQYVLVFADLDKRAAQLICGNILKQLLDSLLGTVETSEIGVRTAVVELDGSVRLESVALKELLDEALRPPPQAEPPAAPVHPAAEGPDNPHDERLAMLHSALQEEMAPRAVQFVFRPVWDVANEVVSTYISLPAHSRDHYTPFNEYGSSISPSDVDTIFGIDSDRLVRALIVATRAYSSGVKYFSSVPVHFESLASGKRRREYLQLLGMMPGHLAPYFGFALQGMPLGIPVGRLAELVTLLHAHSRRVILQCPVEDRDHASYAQAGVRLLATAAPAYGSEAEALEKVRLFATSAKRNNLAVHVGGVRSEAMLNAFLQQGVRFVSGPVIGRDLDRPEHMTRLSESDLRARFRARQPDVH